MFASCGDTEIIIPQKDVYSNDTIPSFIVDAVNNAKLICDSIGEIKEVHRGTDSFSFKDEHGNIINVDVFGNAEVCTCSNDTINIDYTVKESMATPNDSLYNTIWIGANSCSMSSDYDEIHTHQLDESAFSFYKYIKENNVEFEETECIKERYDTICKTICQFELKFRNNTCVLNNSDTITTNKRVYADRYKKIKIDNQFFLPQNCDGSGSLFFINIENDTAYVSYYRLAVEAIEEYDDVEIIIMKQQLDSDSTFSILEEAGKEVVREEVISTEVRKKHEAYNYRCLQDGRICIYNHDKKYYDDGHLGFKFPYVLNDTTKWLDVKFTKEEDMKH
jgi:hypothetical protein